MSEKIEIPKNALPEAQAAHQAAVDALAKAQADSKNAADRLAQLRIDLEADIASGAQTILDGGAPRKGSGEALRHNIAIQERVVEELQKRETKAQADERTARLALCKVEWLDLCGRQRAQNATIERARKSLEAEERALGNLNYEENDLRKKRLAVESEIKAANPAPPKEKPVAFLVKQTVAGDPPLIQVKQTIKGVLQPTITYIPKPKMSTEAREARERRTA
ncbi:MAG: hypothetical protein NTX50_22120 [Candidatus Sumerlaeota bacterium]|nr:hypothetical protein [Candidatus Sumerlaeota bacterium]